MSSFGLSALFQSFHCLAGAALGIAAAVLADGLKEAIGGFMVDSAESESAKTTCSLSGDRWAGAS